MKLKVKYAILIAMLGITNMLSAQWITAWEFLPDSPNTSDFFAIKINITHPSGTCDLIDSLAEITIINDTIIVKGLYNLGPMTTICYSTDTFQIGKLNLGTYYLQFDFFYYNDSSPPSLQDSRDTVLTVDSGFVGVDKKFSEKGHIVVTYPNPSKDKITVELELSANLTKTSITIYDFLGRKIQQYDNGNLKPGKHYKVITTDNLRQGQYFLTIDLDGATQTIKYIKL